MNEQAADQTQGVEEEDHPQKVGPIPRANEKVERPAVYDFRGREIQIGSVVIVAGKNGQLCERVVRMLNTRGAWSTVHFERGSYTSPDKVVVVDD